MNTVEVQALIALLETTSNEQLRQTLRNAINVEGSDVLTTPITGFSSGAGTVAAADTLLQALNKINGNVAVNTAALAGVVTGTPNVKIYRALLTQSGTGAPDAVVLENSLGGTVVWARSSTGTYTATLLGAFTEDKTFYSVPPITDGDALTASFMQWTSANVMTWTTLSEGSQADSKLIDTPVEILVYP